MSTFRSGYLLILTTNLLSLANTELGLITTSNSPDLVTTFREPSDERGILTNRSIPLANNEYPYLYCHKKLFLCPYWLQVSPVPYHMYPYLSHLHLTSLAA